MTGLLGALKGVVKEGGGWLFESAKSRRPLAVASDLMLDALVQSALHPGVRSIEAAPADIRSAAGLPVFVNLGDCGRTLVVVCAADLPRGRLAMLGRLAERGGMSILALDRRDLAAEPYASNCRTVWSCRRRRVDAGDKSRILRLLGEEISLPLAEVCREVRSDEAPLRVISALACADALELDLLSGPLGPDSAVRSRTEMSSGESGWSC